MLRWIKKCLITLLNDDQSPYPLIQVSYNQVTKPTYRWGPYGVSSMPPINGQAIVLAASGRGSDPIAMCDHPLGRFKGLKEYEVQVGNYDTRSNVKFAENGNVELSISQEGNLVVTVANGDVEVVTSGDISVTSEEGDLSIQVRSGGVTLESSGDVDVTAPTVNITGNLTISGTVTAMGDVVAGSRVSLISHVHAGVQSGGSSTAPPT